MVGLAGLLAAPVFYFRVGELQKAATKQEQAAKVAKAQAEEARKTRSDAEAAAEKAELAAKAALAETKKASDQTAEASARYADAVAQYLAVEAGAPQAPVVLFVESVKRKATLGGLSGLISATPLLRLPLARLEHQDAVNALAFSPDGKTVATASHDRTARLWDVATGKLRAPPLAHPAALQAVAFSPDGTLLATGGRDDAARLWDVATGKPIGTPMRHKTAVRFLAFDPGGKTLLTSGFETTAADRSVRLWTVPAPLPGDGERLALWAQVLTGMELDSQGAVRALEPEEWQRRRRQLEKLGGADGK